MEAELEVVKPRRVWKYEYKFDEFWNVYPKKAGKPYAYKKYKELIESGVAPDRVIACARAYAKECADTNRNIKYTLNASTFVGPQDRWKDYEGKFSMESKMVENGVDESTAAFMVQAIKHGDIPF